MRRESSKSSALVSDRGDRGLFVDGTCCFLCEKKLFSLRSVLLRDGKEDGDGKGNGDGEAEVK